MGKKCVAEVGPRAYSIIDYKGKPHIILDYIRKKPERVRICPWEYPIHVNSIRENSQKCYNRQDIIVLFLDRIGNCKVLFSW